MTTARRGFLKLIGLAPLAAPAAAQSLAAQRGAAALGALAFGGNSVGPALEPSGYGSPWVRSGLTKFLWRSLQKERDEKARRFERGLVYRYGALEPGIAMMRSWSPTFANAVQRRRDEAHAEWLRETDGKLWPGTDE